MSEQGVELLNLDFSDDITELKDKVNRESFASWSDALNEFYDFFYRA